LKAEHAPFQMGHHNGSVSEIARTCDEYILCEDAAYKNELYIACKACKTDVSGSFVYTAGANQKGVCASLAEGGEKIASMCTFDDQNILRLIDRELDHAVCIDDGTSATKACQFWHNDSWVNVLRGESSPFYGDCKQYVSCMKGQGMNILACVECYDFDDEDLTAIGTSPNMTSSSLAGSPVFDQHMCIENAELNYYKTCDVSQRYQSYQSEAVLEKCPGNEKHGTAVSNSLKESQASVDMLAVEQIYKLLLGVADVSDIDASLRGLLRAFLYDGEKLLKFDPPDVGCACYKECYREKKSIFEFEYPVYVCTECLPGYVPAKVATGFPNAARGFFFRDLNKCPDLDGNILEFPTMCVKESIIDAGHFCPIDIGECKTDLVNITIEIEQLKNLPDYDNLNTDEGLGRFLFDVYSTHSQFFGNIIGGIVSRYHLSARDYLHFILTVLRTWRQMKLWMLTLVIFSSLATMCRFA
jgi:hypothetical protein